MNKTQAIILACSIALCACSPEQTNQQSGNTNSSPAAIEKAKARCMNTLHHVSSRDDLIKQMFQTALEDDCLYHFTSTELEKIWGIPVFDYVQVDPMMLPIPPNKDIESPIGLYVEKDTVPAGTSFYIEMTLSELNQHFSIFPEGHFPSSLPTPKSFAVLEEALRPHHPTYIPPYQSQPQAKIKASRTYYWFKDNRAVAVTSWVGEVMHLWFTNSRRYSEISDDSLAQADHSE